jgi:sarcinarray family protein
MSILLDLLKKDSMTKAMVTVSLIGLLFIIHAIPVHTAAECDYGSVHACMMASDDIWKNATTHPLLKRGESFNIKIVVTTKTPLSMLYIKLHEYGTPVFEIMEGPTAIEQLLECRGGIPSGQIFSYTWKIRVRPDTTWVNGYAPLEVFVQFNKNDTDEHRINFDVVTAFVIDELWENYKQENTNENFSSRYVPSIEQPGFEFGQIIIAVILLGIFVRLRYLLRKN